MLENFQRNWHRFSNLLTITMVHPNGFNGFYFPVTVTVPSDVPEIVHPVCDGATE